MLSLVITSLQLRQLVVQLLLVEGFLGLQSLLDALIKVKDLLRATRLKRSLVRATGQKLGMRLGAVTEMLEQHLHVVQLLLIVFLDLGALVLVVDFGHRHA